MNHSSCLIMEHPFEDTFRVKACFRTLIRRAKRTKPASLADKLLLRYGGLESFLTDQAKGEP